MKNGILLFVFAVGIGLSISSCSDKHYAKELNGKWVTDYVMSSSDGEKDSITEHVTYKYIPDSQTDGGTFTEIRYYSTNEIEDDDYNYRVKLRTTISGKYEVNLDDLFLKYDVSTLAVDITANDVKIDLKNYSELNSYVSDIFTLTDPAEEIAKSFKKEIYKSLFEYYKEVSSPDCGFKDLKIDGHTMSFASTDGRFEYTKEDSISDLE